MTDEQKKCTICNGTEAEHAGLRHAFTTEEGGLLETPDQKRQRAGEVSPMAVQPGQVIRLAGAPTNEATAMNRLIEVLMEKGLITMAEGFYIATGNRVDDPKFADPAAHAGISATGGNL